LARRSLTLLHATLLALLNRETKDNGLKRDHPTLLCKIDYLLFITKILGKLE